MEIVVNVAFVIAAVAFFKQRFGFFGWKAVLSAFLVSALVVYLPDLYAAFPQAQPYLEKLIGIVQVFITAAGSYDLAIDVKSKSVG